MEKVHLKKVFVDAMRLGGGRELIWCGFKLITLRKPLSYETRARRKLSKVACHSCHSCGIRKTNRPSQGLKSSFVGWQVTKERQFWDSLPP